MTQKRESSLRFLRTIITKNKHVTESKNENSVHFTYSQRVLLPPSPMQVVYLESELLL